MGLHGGEALPGPDPRQGPWPHARRWRAQSAFALAYVAASLLGMASRLPGTHLAMVWPAAAVGFLWVLWSRFRGRRTVALSLGLIVVVHVAVNLAAGNDRAVSLAFALAAAVQALTTCLLMDLRPEAWRLRRPSDLFSWVVACFAGAAISTATGTLVMCLIGGGELWTRLVPFLVRNGTSTFIFAAVALTVEQGGWRSLWPSRGRRLEALVVFAGLQATYVLVFVHPVEAPLMFALVPLSMWLALRCSTSFTALSIHPAAALLGLGAERSVGPYGQYPPDSKLLLSQTFLAVISVIMLGLALHRDEREVLIADLEAARARADEQAEQLRAASQHKTEFLATMSHEIRTPLNGVLGFTALLAQSPGDPAAQEWAQAADRSGRTLLGIVNNGLDLAKIEAGAVELEEIELDVVDVAREAVLPSQLNAREAGIELRVESPRSFRPRRLGDSVRLRQIMTNLVANAVKFTESGTVTLALSEGPGDVVRIEVVDTGIGMTQEQQDRLFVPFQQASADTTRRYGGTGLGLSIARGLVEVMDGRIVVRSTPGVGTTFSVELRLPVAVTPAPAPRAATEAAGDGTTAWKVLVADDNPVNRALAKATFERRGMTVDVVTDGDEAVEAVLTGRYDVVFMDWRMPRLDGVEATRRIRAAESGHVPIVAMTAGALAEEREACLEAGMDGFLPKPWTINELDDVLAHVASLLTYPVVQELGGSGAVSTRNRPV